MNTKLSNVHQPQIWKDYNDYNPTMPFTSRKSRANSTSVNRSTNSSSSRRNPFSRLRSDPVENEPRLPPTSNPFITLSQIDANVQGRSSNGMGNNILLNDLKGDLESLSISVFGDDHQATNQSPTKIPETIPEEGNEENHVSDSGWEQVSSKHRRDSIHSAQELRSVARADRSGVESSNWRTGTGTTNRPTWHPPRGAGGRTRFTGQYTRPGTGRIFFEVAVGQLAEGVIIWCKETRECYDDNAEGEVFSSSDGQKHLRKGRFAMVEKVHTYSLTKAPLYTYHGKGITEKKSEGIKKEHVGIRPPHIPREQYVQQNGYAPLEVEYMDDKSEQLHEKTVVHFTERVTIPFDTKIRVVGRLTPDSIGRLRALRAQFGC